jgi:hypothetical protein
LIRVKAGLGVTVDRLLGDLNHQRQELDLAGPAHPAG